MSMWPTLLLFALGLSTMARGQDQATQEPTNDSSATRSTPAPALSGIVGIDAESSSQDIQELPQVPTFLGGQGSTLALTTEMERSNYLRGGINISEAYNDNAFLGNGPQVGNTTFSVFPNIEFD